MLQEEWKDIVGYEGLYQISSYGNVRSIKRDGTSGGVLHPFTTKEGYKRVCLSKNNVVRKELVHRIVASHFLENPDKLPIINHKDECRTNNCVWNLEWCTAQYNLNYGTARERSAKHRNYGEIGVKHSKPVLQIGSDGKVIRQWSSIKEAAESVGCHAPNIVRACRKKKKKSGGFRWTYAEVAT